MLLHEETPAAPRAPRPPPPPPVRRPWGLALAVVGALGLAHLGLFLLLTASARTAAAEIEERYSAAELASGEPAGAAGLEDPSLAESRRSTLKARRRALADHRQHVSLVGYGLLASFLAQTGLIVFLRLRTRPAPAPGTPAAG